MPDLNKKENLAKTKKRNLRASFIMFLLFGFSNGFLFVLQPLLLEITGSLFPTGFILTVLIPGTIIGVIICAIYESIFFPVESIYLTNLTEDRKAESYGTVSLITDGSHIPTSIISGSLVDFIHPISHSIVSFGGLIFLLGYLIKFFDNENPLEEE